MPSRAVPILVVLLAALGLFALIFPAPAHGQESSFPIRAEASDGSAVQLALGVDPDATSGIDDGDGSTEDVGEESLPPLLSDVFQVRFTGDARSGSNLSGVDLEGGTSRDIREKTAPFGDPFSGTKTHEITFVIPSGSGVTLDWDLPGGAEGQLSDQDGNVLIETLAGDSQTTISPGNLTSAPGPNTFRATLEMTYSGLTGGGPTAPDDQFQVTEDQPQNLDVRSNDRDPEGDPLRPSVVSGEGPSDGTVTFNSADSTFTYNPDDNFNGTDSFTYESADGFGGRAEADVTVNVSAVNDEPTVSTNSGLTLDEGGTSPITTEELSASDVDDPASDLTFDVASGGGPSNGTLLVGGSEASSFTQQDLEDGSVEYEHDGSETTSDSFTFDLTDASGAGPSGRTFSITVNPVNDAPTFESEVSDKAISEDQTAGPYSFTISDAETEASSLTLSGTSDNTDLVPSDGIQFGGSGSERTVTVTPSPDSNGTAGIEVTLSDGEKTTSSTFNLAVQSVNDPPVASDDDYSVTEGETLQVGAEEEGVLGNDTDVEGDDLEASLVSDTDDGDLTLDADGTFEYAPDEGFTGTDSFTYRAADGNGGTDEATASITVSESSSPPAPSPNDPPVARNDTFSVQAGSTLAVEAAEGTLANDTDPDGDDLEASLVSDAGDGDLTLGADGSLEYVPDEGFAGTDGFTYRAADGNGGADEASATIFVEENQPPSVAALPDTTIKEDGALEPLEVLVTDQETAPEDLSLRAETGNPALVPSDSISLSGPGPDSTASLRVVPRADSNGTAEIRLIATEDLPGGEAQRDTSAFALTVEPVNDPPEAISGLPDDTLAAAGPPLQLTGLQGTLFRDPDGDRLSIEASSSAPSVLEATRQGGNGQGGEGQSGDQGQNPDAILQPQSAGEAEVTLTASDGEQSVSAAPFTVVVEEQPSGREVADEAAQAPVDTTSGEASVSFGETGAEATLQRVQSGGTIRVSFFQGRAGSDQAGSSQTGVGQAENDQAGTSGPVNVTMAETKVLKAGAADQFENVSRYRWEIDGGTARFDSASVRFALADPDVVGVGAPEEVTVLVDSAENGEFESVPTRFDDGDTPSDSTDDALVAEGLTGFSTFRLASNSDENPLQARPSLEIAGIVRYPTVSGESLTEGRPASGVAVEVSAVETTAGDTTAGDTTAADTTSADGGFLVTGLPEGDYRARPVGIPEVQNVSTADAFRVILGSVGQRPFTGPFQRAVADVNGDGRVNATDALQIARFDLGMIAGFEAGPLVSDSASVALSDSSRSGVRLRVAETGDVRLDGGETDGSGQALTSNTLSPGQGPAAAVQSGSGPAPEAAVDAGETFEVPVRMSRGAKVGAYQMAIGYDADVASFEGVKATQEIARKSVLTNVSKANASGANSSGADASGTSASGEATVQVSWFDRSGESALDLSGGAELVTLQFKASEEIEEKEFAPQVSSGEIVGPEAAPISAGVELQAVNVGAPVPEEFALKGSYPNPARGQATIEVDLPSEATVTVKVYNVLGQRVLRTERPVSAGAGQTIQLDGSGLASGQYFYRVKADLQEVDLQETELEKETAEASGRLTIVR